MIYLNRNGGLVLLTRFKIKKGFSLAEVLVTLTVIAVLAVLTIPALMNDIQNAQYKTAYRKAFSIAS